MKTSIVVGALCEGHVGLHLQVCRAVLLAEMHWRVFLSVGGGRALHQGQHPCSLPLGLVCLGKGGAVPVEHLENTPGAVLESSALRRQASERLWCSKARNGGSQSCEGSFKAPFSLLLTVLLLEVALKKG